MSASPTTTTVAADASVAAAAVVGPVSSIQSAPASAAAVAAAVAEPVDAEHAAAIAESYKQVLARVAAAAAAVGAPSVRLVAVSKTKPAAALAAAYGVGCRDFGENYIQELCAKAPLLPAEVRWRMIGHVQSNKARELVAAVPNLAVVETVDSAKLADKLEAACAANDAARGGRRLEVLLQVNTSGEESKSGLTPHGPAVEDLALHIRDQCPHLEFRGLMTIGMPDFTSRPENFECLNAVRARVATRLGVAATTLELSMGMSGDFENAIAMGSTNVRVGTTIFGARSYGAPK
jgi:pyridoxal phosphate enzyme (YggS family)